MALIKCPECGREISDKSEQCIHCGYKLEQTDSDQGITPPDNGAIPTEKNETVNIEAGSVSGNSDRNKTAIVIAIVCIVCLIGVAGILLWFSRDKSDKSDKNNTPETVMTDDKNDKNNTSESKMTDEEKIEKGASVLGETAGEDGELTISEDMISFIESVELFGYEGHIEHGMTQPDPVTNEGYIDGMYWVSDDEYGEKDVKKVVKGLEKIYGEYGKKDVRYYDEIEKAYMWKNTEEFQWIVCGINSENKILIIWISDLTAGNEADITESNIGKIYDLMGSTIVDKESGMVDLTEEYQEFVAAPVDLWGMAGAVTTLEGNKGKSVDTIWWKAEQEYDQSTYDELRDKIIEKYGNYAEEYEYDGSNFYAWEDVDGFSTIALQHHVLDGEHSIYLIFQSV